MNQQYPDSPYKRPLNAAQATNSLLAICLIISLGIIAAAIFANPNC